jgi:hypothetical protein
MKNIFFVLMLIFVPTRALKFDDYSFLLNKLEVDSCNNTCTNGTNITTINFNITLNDTIDNKTDSIIRINPIRALNCSEMKDYFQILISIDGDISNLRKDLLSITLDSVEEASFLEKVNNRTNVYTEIYDNINDDLQKFKEDVLKIQYDCNKLFFMIFNIENNLNNVEYLFENGNINLSKVNN